MSYYVDENGKLQKDLEIVEANKVTVVFEAYLPSRVLNEQFEDIPFLLDFLKKIGKDIDQ